MASPLVGDVDSDGIQEIIIPVCDNDACELVSSLWCYKYNMELGKVQWHSIAVDLNVNLEFSEFIDNYLFIEGNYSSRDRWRNNDFVPNRRLLTKWFPRFDWDNVAGSRWHASSINP